MHVKKIFQDRVRNLAIIVIFFAVSRIINVNGDILESYKYISPDGLDWIIQGRLIGVDGVVIPVLRNSGYVFVSKIDWLLGAHGFSFAITAFLGLYLQAHVLIELMKQYEIRRKIQYLGIVIYFLIFIHFISLYILPDGIAVGIMCIALHLSLKGLKTNLHMMWTFGLIMGVVATTFQIYAFSIFLCLALGVFVSKITKQAKVKRFSEIAFVTLISLLIIGAWREWNAHLTVPSQINLLKLSFDMFPFYGHTLTLLFLPLFMVSIIAICLPRVRVGISSFEKLIFLMGFALLVSSMFYQWPESRFTYSGVALVYLAGLPLALKTIDSYLISLKGLSKVARAVPLTLSLSLLSLLLFGPANPWQPRLEQVQIGHTWPIEVLNDYSNNPKSRHRYAIRELKDHCLNNDPTSEKSATIVKFGFSEYEVSQLDLYAAYCLFK